MKACTQTQRFVIKLVEKRKCIEIQTPCHLTEFCDKRNTLAASEWAIVVFQLIKHLPKKMLLQPQIPSPTDFSLDQLWRVVVRMCLRERQSADYGSLLILCFNSWLNYPMIKIKLIDGYYLFSAQKCKNHERRASILCSLIGWNWFHKSLCFQHFSKNAPNWGCEMVLLWSIARHYKHLWFFPSVAI